VAVSDAGICNIALIRIGQLQRINALTDPSEAARACKDLYDDARDAVLADHRWRFATGRADLATLASTTRAGWQFAATLPADFLIARYVQDPNNVVRAPIEEDRIPFEIEDDSQAGGTGGAIILVDYEGLELVYTRRIKNPVRFPPHFVDALAFKLASDLAFGLAKKPQLGTAMLQAYGFALERAVARDLNQAHEDPEPESELVRVRR
jgi:hypothetical protein